MKTSWICRLFTKHFLFAILTMIGITFSILFCCRDVRGLPWLAAMVIELLPRWLRRPLPLHPIKSLPRYFVPQPKSQQVYRVRSSLAAQWRLYTYIIWLPSFLSFSSFSLTLFFLFFFLCVENLHFFGFCCSSPCRLLLLFSITGFYLYIFFFFIICWRKIFYFSKSKFWKREKKKIRFTLKMEWHQRTCFFRLWGNLNI